MGCLPCNGIPTSAAKINCGYLSHIHLGKLNNAHTAEVIILILGSIAKHVLV